MENSDVRFCKSSHQSEPVSYLFTLTGWAGKAFIRYRRCLLPKTKGISNSNLKRWALFGLVDKVGIVWVYTIPGHWTGMDWTLDRLNLSSELITSLTSRGVAIAQ